MMAAQWTKQMALGVLSLFVLTACPRPYELPSLTAAHPAHSEAIAAPEAPPSNTLAYGPADRPSPQPAHAVMQHTGAAEPPGQHAVVGAGKVIAVVPSNDQLVVDHEAIHGFMDAMTMGYRVDPPALLEGLQAGDHIRFTIDTKQKAIVNIEKRQP
jgi:Cu/Ag efflux protein CusF